MKNNMLQNIRRNASLVGLKLKKHAPEIMVVVGAVGTVGAAVMACKATLKLDETLDDCRSRKNELEEYKGSEEYPNDVYKKDLCKVTVKNAVEIGKLYAPSVILGATSLSVIFAANNIQRKRNASLAAAYATLDNMYRRYRKNVVESFGEDVDHDMRFGINHEKIEEEVEDANGKKHKVKKVIDVIDVDPEDPSNYSDYARFFDSSVEGWDKDPEINMFTLKGYQNYCNQLLATRGYLFLNDVYKIIGFESSMAGQSVGWIYDNPDGDGYVDFHIFDNKKANRRFVNGYEPVILLDFNPDGDLLNNPKLNGLLMGKLARK